MSIFIGSLAFDESVLLDSLKLGVLAGSLVSAVIGLTPGVLLLRRGGKVGPP